MAPGLLRSSSAALTEGDEQATGYSTIDQSSGLKLSQSYDVENEQHQQLDHSGITVIVDSAASPKKLVHQPVSPSSEGLILRTKNGHNDMNVNLAGSGNFDAMYRRSKSSGNGSTFSELSTVLAPTSAEPSMIRSTDVQLPHITPLPTLVEGGSPADLQTQMFASSDDAVIGVRNHSQHRYLTVQHRGALSTKSPMRDMPNRQLDTTGRTGKNTWEDILGSSVDREQDIASKSFRFRHTSYKDSSISMSHSSNSSLFTCAGLPLGGIATGRAGSISNQAQGVSNAYPTYFIGDDGSSEVSFEHLLVRTANSWCRGIPDIILAAQLHTDRSSPISRECALGHLHGHCAGVTSGKTLQQALNQTNFCLKGTYIPTSVSLPQFPIISDEEEGVELRYYDYDPETLDSFQASLNRNYAIHPSFQISVLGYSDPSTLKKQLNDLFREHFPDVQLTYSKMLSLKREMKKIVLRCGLDLWCVAQSFVYFEKLILKRYIRKPNRKMVAGACLLLAAKLDDIRKSKITALIEETADVFRIDKEDLLVCEFNVFLALDFTLFVLDCEVVPHLERLLQEIVISGGSVGISGVTGDALGSSGSSAYSDRQGPGAVIAGLLGAASMQHGLTLIRQHRQQHGALQSAVVAMAATTATGGLTSNANTALQTSIGHNDSNNTNHNNTTVTQNSRQRRNRSGNNDHYE